MMKKRVRCAGVVFFDENNKVLLEDRRKISKHGEHWSFFGGSIEKGETIKQALLREIKEELDYDLKGYKFLGKYDFLVEDLELTYYMYVSKTPPLEELNPHRRAGLKKFTIKQALRLKITEIDKQILRDVRKMVVEAGVAELLVSETAEPNPLKELVGFEKSKTGEVGLGVDDIYLS